MNDIIGIILGLASGLVFWAWYKRNSENAARREWTAYHNWLRKGLR